MTEEQLIIKCIDNNRQAQKLVYDKYCAYLMGVCLRYTSTKEEAEDLLQEAFINIFKNIHTFKGTGSLKGWMARICVNACIQNFRKRKNTILEVEEDEQKMVASNESIYDQFSAAEIVKQIQSLPDGYRIVFNLYEIEGYKHEEIAQKLNISPGTSKSQLNRAKKLLRKKLELLNYNYSSANG